MRDGVNRIQTVEEFLEKQYSYQPGKTTKYESLIEVEVESKTEMQIEIIWYNILDTGSLILRNSSNDELIIPYSVVVGMGFDTKYSETLI